MRLTGHHIFITGGGSGIGLAMARAFLARGNRVTVCGRDGGKLEQAARENPGLATLVADIARPEGLALIAAELAGPLQSVSILVNNAAVGDAYCLRRDPAAVSRLEQDLATDLLGPIRLTGLFLPTLLRQPEAAVVNVTSGFALWPCAVVPGYSTAKGGLRAFTGVLRRQLAASRIRVFEVLPPLVATALVRQVDTRKITPEQVAKATLDGMAGERLEICIGEVRLLRWGLRFCPWLVERIMLRYPVAQRELDRLYAGEGETGDKKREA